MLYDTLLQRLREFFVDVTDANVVFHLGDLFDPSQFRLRDVFLKTELINALHFPFEIKAAYFGDVKVEGFVGFVAGSPLAIGVDNVCLVVGHKSVNWDDELALRYAKELLLAILQNVLAAPIDEAEKRKTKQEAATHDMFSVSPVKWIHSKIQATIAETSVKLERLHIRFESEFEGEMIAYGVNIPTVQLSTRELDDQILRRREQPGVKYPRPSSDNTACKRLYLGNLSLYCDLHATSFLGPLPPKPSATTPRASLVSSTAVPIPVVSPAERLAFMRQKCLQPFDPSVDRDLVLISALWVKLDFARTSANSTPSAWSVGAIDVVTEEIKVTVDFTQLTALNEQLARLNEFFQRTQRRAWRPSSVNRDRVPPLQVELSTTSLLPLVSQDVMANLWADKSGPRCLSRPWLRGMWLYAARCVLLAGRNGDPKRVRLGAAQENDEFRQLDVDRQRYIALYTRSLSEEILKIVVFGKNLLPSSPRATDVRKKQQQMAPLPVYEPLTLAEQWELSDLVERLPIDEQRRLCQKVFKLVRHDYTCYQSSANLSPTPSGKPLRSLSIEIPQEHAESPRRGSGASISPKHGSVESPASAVSTAPLPHDFIAHHHHHYTRSRAESSPAGSPTKFHDISLASPAGSPTHHGHLTHSASAPMSRLGGTSPTKYFAFRSPPSPTNVSKQQWLVESLLPAWLLSPSRAIPLINWHIGPITVRLHHRSPETEGRSSTASLPPRSTVTFIEFHADGCTGCALVSKAPTVSFLVELRLGLVRAALVDQASPSVASSRGSGSNAITTDYIHEESDGFLYVGLKYNFKRSAGSLLADDEPWDVKAKLCVGTIHIEYSDAALQAAMQGDRTGDAPSSIRLDSASYVTIIHDVLSNWKAFLQRVQPTKTSASPTTSSDPQKDALEVEAKSELQKARVARLLNVLMQQCSCVDVDTNGVELQLSMLTRHVVERVLTTDAGKTASSARPLPLFDSEQVLVTFPSTSAGLQNRPLLSECQLHAGGARLKFRTTKHGRAAVVDYVLHRVFPNSNSQ